MESITSDGFTISSSGETADEMRAAIAGNTPEPEPVPEPEPEPKPAAVEPEKKTAKPRSDPYARVKQATAEAAEAKREREQIARERDDARAEATRYREEAARIAAWAAAPREPVASPPPERFPSYQEMAATKPELTPEQWLDARDEWRDAKKAETEGRRRAEESHQQRVGTFRSKITAVETAEPGFWAGLGGFTASLVPARELPPGAQLTGRNAIADVIIDSDAPDKLLRHFRDDPADFQRISTLHPMLAIRELGKLEARLDAASSTGPASKAPVISQAKPPLKPVSGSPVVSDDSAEDDDQPFEQFFKKGNAADPRINPRAAHR